MRTEGNAPHTASAAGGHKRHWAQNLTFLIIGVLFVLGSLAYSALAFGRVEGQEFAPDSFTRRQFIYYEIPLLGWQITPITHSDITNSLESHLIGQKLITSLNTPDARKRWDLVIAQRGSGHISNQIMAQGDARILCEYLDAADSQDASIWLQWTEQHPELAKVVWPLVARLARQELYFLVPDLLVQARNVTDPAKLLEDAHVALASNYVTFGRTQQQLSNHAAAIELFTEALKLVPLCGEALVGRAESLTALGKNDMASADLAQAQSLGIRH